MADLLGDTPLTREQTTYLKAVKTSGETLLSLIEEVLDFSRSKPVGSTSRRGHFRLLRSSMRWSSCSGPRAQARGLEICCYVDERLPARVVGDAARLRRALLNLAGNAIKFTECGGVSIIVEAGARPDAITISVRAVSTSYDRVLMDLHMPEVDGREATGRIRAIEAEAGASRTPILALTTNPSTEDREICVTAGMDGFLLKPLDRERLAAALAASGSAALAA